MNFPPITATNLHRQKLNLPEDFQGDFNVLVIAFQQWHQASVNTWIPFLRELEGIHPGVRYYELPTIYRMNTFAQWFINEGMRVGIPDTLARERTVTLYIDKSTFRNQLEIQDEEDIQLRLIDRSGVVYWSSSGVFSPEKAQELIAYLKTLQHSEITN